MTSQYFHSDNEEEKPPRIVAHSKKIVSAFDEQQGRAARVVILTTEGIEYEAVRAHLNSLREEVHRGTVYERGTFLAYQQTWDVSIVEIGEGGAAASFEAERAINYYHPDVILFISTANGVHGVQSGDVVSATKVYAYEAGRSGETFQARPAVWNVSYEMEQRARAEARRSSWLQRIKGNAPANTPHIVLAPVASGEKEITSTHSKVFEILHAHYEDTAAVEMGGYGVLQAARAQRNIDALVVCGIAETIQEQSVKDKDRQTVAAHHASAFAFEVLSKLESKMLSQPPQATEKPPLPEIVEAVEVFYSYVDADEKLVERLRQQLVMLKRIGQISDWYAGKVGAGRNLNEHQRHLETAHLILLLVSPDYLASEYHYNVEVKRAMERQRVGDAKVVPILLRQTDGLQHTGFGGLQTIPRNGKAVNQLKDLDQAFKEIALEIEEIVKSLRSSR